jgi:opacity protein-like surface antigen
LRKLTLLAVVCGLLFLASFASAQQGDVFFGAGTLLSSAPSATDLAAGNIAERGGTYLDVGGDVAGFKHHLGFMVETSWRASQADYFSNVETYRPILTDFNALYQPHLTKKIGLDVFGGIGLQSTRFYQPYPTQCGFYGCINYTSQHNFVQHVGAGIRYYFWGHVFVRPEIHYYHIDGNDTLNSFNSTSLGFSSDNVFRVGGSIGYTIGGD